MTIHEQYRMSELDEVQGVLHSIEKTEIDLVALIGKINVLLPEDLTQSLTGLLGRQIAILRLDGYRVRCMDEEQKDQKFKR